MPNPKRESIRAAYRAALRPRPPIRMQDWIEANVVIPEDSDSPRPGPFRHLVPAADGIMDALQDPDIHTVIVRAPVQLMKTTILVNAMLYWMCETPGPMLVFEPDDPLAKMFLKKKLDPLARQIPELAADFTGNPKSSREREFAGGDLEVLSGLASSPEVARTAKYILVDEFRKFREDLIQSFRGRGAQYAEMGMKMYVTSSCGDFGACRTTAALEASDWRVWEVPCPECGALQPLEWESVEWTEEPHTARLACGECSHRLTDAELKAANKKGRWRPTRKPDRPGIAGFTCNFMASPFVSLAWGVAEFVGADRHMKRTGQEEQLKQFFQDWLAIPFQSGGGMQPKILEKKCRAPFKAGHAPAWVSNITLCVDTQDDRLEWEFAGWAAVEVEAEQDAHRVRKEGAPKFAASSLAFAGRFYQLRRAGLQYGVIEGDPGLSDVWDKLDVIRTGTRFAVGGKVMLRPTVGLIDSGGHHGEEVKKFVHRIVAETAAGSPRGCAVWGCKGASVAGQPLIRLSGHKDTLRDWGGNFYLLGTDGAKDLCHAMLRASRYAKQKDKSAVYPRGKGAGYDLQYFEGLCSEKKMHEADKRNRVSVRWFKDASTRNEPLDLFVYSLAAAHLIGLPRMVADAKRVAERLEKI